MFRRRRASSNPATQRTPPTHSASLAAVQAFTKARDSNPALSSAAAAAALRTHVAAPTRVGDTVTKRMVRKGSTSSHGSGSNQPGLRRHSSSGSMTERSFRAPSPSRNGPISTDPDVEAPPVPAVPRDVPGIGSAQRRASSLEPPYRGASPVGRGGGRGASLDRGGSVVATNGRGQRTTLSQVPENEGDNPRPMNFSRPISPPASPVATKSTPARNSGWFGGPVVDTSVGFRGSPKPRPNTANALSQFEQHNVRYSVQSAADTSITNKRTHLSHGLEGARLATGSMHAKPSGTAVVAHRNYEPAELVDPKSPNAVYDPSTRKFIHKQDAMARFRELEDQGVQEQHVPPVRPQTAPPQQMSQPSPVPIREAPKRSPSPSPRRVEESVLSPQDEHVNENEEDELENQRQPAPSSRPGAVLARQSSEDYATQDLRPSPDANISRKIEPSVPEPVKEFEESPPMSPKLAHNQDSPYPRLSTPIPAITKPVDTLGKGGGSIRGGRTASLSPPRNAHFAAVATELGHGLKHQPLPRSSSPAKSALKTSPSASRRNSSPITNSGSVNSRGAPSEASDTVSEDGTKKKKKSVRVSFEEAPVIAGTSAYAEVDSPSSPMGINQSKWSTSNHEDTIDEVMTPRPVLPSFGSIRDKNRRQAEGDVPEKVTETVSSSLSTSVGSIGDPLEASSDHVVGGILAQDFASKKNISPNDPLPPEVTSVEGSGYWSDSDQSDRTPVEPNAPVKQDVLVEHNVPVEQNVTVEPNQREIPKVVEPEPAPLEPKTLTTPVESKPPVEVPIIAVQPATPSLSEKPEPKAQSPFMPGGWGDEEFEREDAEPEPTPVSKPVAPIAPIAPATATVEPPKLHLPAINTQETESTDDDESIYSDAYEELTDEEDGGFASIDAMVESPIAAPSPGLMNSRYADQSASAAAQSSLRNEYTGVAEKKDPIPEPNVRDATRQDWREARDAQAVQEQEILRTASITPKAAQTPVETAVPVVNIPKTKKTEASEHNPQAALSAKPAVPAHAPVSSQPSAQPRKSAMKKAATPAQTTSPQETHMKKTMRATSGPQVPPVDTQMRRSMRSSESLGAPKSQSGLAVSRHSMPPVQSKPPRGALQKKQIPATAAPPKARPQSAGVGAAAAALSGPRPKTVAPTYDSDSDASASSFQRQRRRTPRNDGGRYTMRASMRSGPAPTMRNGPPVRSISPPQMASSPPPTSLRKSMRPSSPPPEPNGLKSSRFSIRSLSPAGRFRLSKSPAPDAPPMPVQTTPPKRERMMATKGKPSKQKAPVSKPRFQSRFGDSSDEDELPRRFQSRFADSDSDDDDYQLPPGLTPVRGIPRKAGDDDQDSTDLEDEESDVEVRPAKLAPKDVEKNPGLLTNGNTAKEGASISAGSLRNSKHAPGLPSFEAGKKAKSKRGFFGLGKKKPSATETTEEIAVSSDALAIPMPPAHREREHRPLTPIGEDDKLVEAGTKPTPNASPKYQRKNAPPFDRSASDSWPLPQPTTNGEELRPQSSDGVVPRRSSLRPKLTKRTSSQISTSQSVVDPESGKSVSFGRTGKKKKFQGLRRVFGIND